MFNLDKFFLGRHSIKPDKKTPGDPESKEYKGITEKGVELSRKKAKEILEFLDNAKEGTIMFIGGSSDQIRTKSTARVYGDEIKNVVREEGREDVLVLTKEDFSEISKDKDGNGRGFTKIIENLQKIVSENKDKKILIDFPLFLNELGMDQWMDDEGGFSEYTLKLLAENNNNHTEAVRSWIKNEGKLGNLQGPNPTEVASDHIKGIERLREFAKKYAQDRPVIIGATGHSWNLDALAAYLANNGVVNEEGFEKAGGKMIGESEMARIEIKEDGEPVLIYNEKELPINTNEKA